MLRLQAARTPDNEQVQKLVHDTENKILAISLVHQKLYQSRDLSRINLHEYIDELAHLIMQRYASSSQHISLTLEIEHIGVLLDTAIPCGLILNELLSNTLQHAFPGGQEGEISITLCRNDAGNLELSFSDNGVGVPQREKMSCEIRESHRPICEERVMLKISLFMFCICTFGGKRVFFLLKKPRTYPEFPFLPIFGNYQLQKYSPESSVPSGLESLWQFIAASLLLALLYICSTHWI